MITVEHLTKRYGDFLAVDDLSFTIGEGHVYGFLGPNGAGKSTTMNIMTGCLSATSGSVKIDGFDIFEQANLAKQRIGYLPEQPPLYMNETPAEYLQFVGEAKGLRGTNLFQQIGNVMEKTRIQEVRNRRISTLSKGYKQRVGIAQALLGNPPVIILDEPTVGLDPLQIIEIRELITQLGEEHTVILSSHILSEIQAICEKILIISKGKLIAFDAPKNLEKALIGSNEIVFVTEASVETVQELVDGLELDGVKVQTEEKQSGYITVHLKITQEDVYGVTRKLFFAFAVRQYEEHKELIANSDEIILSLDTDTVTSLSWEYDSTQLAFHKGDHWVYDGDETFPVDEDQIGKLLAQFQEFGASFRIDEVENLSQYGLDNPLCTIQITAGDKAYSILLGDYSTMDSERYVSIGDDKVYLVKDDPLVYFDVALSDMIDNDETPSFSDVTDIGFSGKESYKIFYEEESSQTYCADDVYFIEQDGNVLPLDTSLVNGCLQTISGLNLKDYVSYNATEEELRACGLDDPDLTVQVDYTTTDEESKEISNTFTLFIGYDEAGEDLQVLNVTTDANSSSGTVNDEDENKTTAFIRVGESPIIYKLVGETSEKLLTAGVNTFRHRQLFPADLDIVTQVEITLEDTDYTLTSKKEDNEQVWLYQEKEVDIGEFDNTLSALRADSFKQEAPDQKEEISLTLHLDNENFPQVHIELYRYDGNDCLAAVDGEPTALVSRTSVVNLIEAVHSIVLQGNGDAVTDSKE